MRANFSDDFLLDNRTAKTLFFEALQDVPIFDFHCHMSAREIDENQLYPDISALWLGGDHYKWRAMRACGMKEDLITGENTPGFEKFRAWASVLPRCAGSILPVWSQLELLRCFGCDELPDEQNANRLWTALNEQLKREEFRPRALLTRARVEFLNTTDDPADTLDAHRSLSEDHTFRVKISPTWRPDRVLDIEKDDYVAYIAELEKASGLTIDSLNGLEKALTRRLDYFMDSGCRSSDHSLKNMIYSPASRSELEEIFNKRMSGQALDQKDADRYQTELLTFLARAYAKRGWVMQLHIGALRDNNSRMLKRLGPNSGFDSINDGGIAEPLSGFLDHLERMEELPKTVIYAMNPRDYDVIGSMIGNFQTGGIPGKLQLGPAWWFNDQIDGIKKQLTAVANLAVFHEFIGMTTDSRCVLSYFSRHEIFRRLLCALLGRWAESGCYPYDEARLHDLARDIAFYNAKAYFDGGR